MGLLLVIAHAKSNRIIQIFSAIGISVLCVSIQAAEDATVISTSTPARFTTHGAV
jgi:hypothetical protein